MINIVKINCYKQWGMDPRLPIKKGEAPPGRETSPMKAY